ncbi:hypothetical protein PPACK8108_LOCUS11243 [Phakopsora pachyrhizi]|uniref:Uncharacterized protein n=1 Tax=Phakopsora pachyrhizi TaxID=170000 RepID=A0AAV0B4T6_PHAPC|nr:hypothetical protein PPACK8108_LOCUS11243 [Phakopsora pachyrhizi]
MNLTPQLGARIGGLVGGQSESSHTESKAQSIPQLQDQFSAVNQSTLVVNLKFEQNLDGNALIAASSVFSEIVAKGPTSNKVPENVTDSHDQWCRNPTFLEALLDDTRREVSNLHIQEQRPAREELYAPIQAEVIRSKLERRNTTSGSATLALSGSEDLDPATFFASLDPTLSKAVLLDQDKGYISTLPQNILAEVDALCDRLSLCHHAIRSCGPLSGLATTGGASQIGTSSKKSLDLRSSPNPFAVTSYRKSL